MTVVTKISKPGYHVEKETDPRNFIFHSGYNHLKTVKSGAISESVNNVSIDNVTIAHGLTYRPLVLAYFRNTANDKWFIVSADPEQTIGRYSINANCSLYVDTTNIYFDIWNYTGSTATFEIKYEAFHEGDV